VLQYAGIILYYVRCSTIASTSRRTSQETLTLNCFFGRNVPHRDHTTLYSV